MIKLNCHTSKRSLGMGEYIPGCVVLDDVHLDDSIGGNSLVG